MPAGVNNSFANGQSADLIIKNAKIITCDVHASIHQAISVKNGRILAIGNECKVSETTNTRSRVIDARGAAVIPGMIDGHAHLDREGLKRIFPSLAGSQSIDDILQRIEALVKDADPGDWIVTMPIGEPPFYFDVPGNLKEKRLPTRWELDKVSPNNPVYIRPIWGFWSHIQPLDSIANSRALEEAGLNRIPKNCPNNIKFEINHTTGEPNGIIHEMTFMPIAELLWFQTMKRFSHDNRVKGIKDAMRAYNASGTTSVFEEHGCAQEVIDAWKAVNNSGDATVRAHLIYSPSWQFAEKNDFAGAIKRWSNDLSGMKGSGDDYLRIGGIFGDLGIDPDAAARLTAAPYTGWSGFNYDSGIPAENMHEFLIAAAQHNVRVSAIWMTMLPFFEAVNAEFSIKEQRWVIGHLGYATPQEIKRLADIGVTMTAHTNRYIFKNGHAIIEDMGPENENNLCPMKSVLEQGIHIGLASDNVPTTLWYPVWEAVTRHNLYIDGPVAREQALTRQQALNCATIEGAYLTGEENEKGSLEVGKLADIVILTDDPLTCAENKIKEIMATITIVNGEIVYDSEGVT